MKRLLIVTPCVPGGLPTQGTVLAEHLRDEGVVVTVLSRARSSMGRVVDVFTRGSWLVARHDVVLVDIFAERAFVYESYAILLSRLLRRRVVAMLHSGLLPDFVRRWPRLTRFVLSRASVVLTPHDYLCEQMSSVGIRIDGTIPNFIEVSKYSYRRRDRVNPRFLYLRGMLPLYNPQMALRAFALVQARYPDASITLAGRPGEDFEPCQALVRELKLRNVDFPGLVPKHEIAALAERHDIHLHTNRVDNMPVTILEMWASGLPVVATSVGGVPRLVQNGVDALVVPSEDHRAMADACFALLSEPELASRLSSNGRARVEQLTWSRVKPLWERVLFQPSTPCAADGSANTGALPLDPNRKPAQS